MPLKSSSVSGGFLLSQISKKNASDLLKKTHIMPVFTAIFPEDGFMIIQ